MSASLSNQSIKLPKILLVDDEPRILRSLKAALKNFYQIFTASNGLQAKELLEQNYDFSVIISDEKMPQMLGHELLIWCKTRFPRMARILMTGYSDMVALQKSINDAEIYKYIAKPWKINDIKTTIDNAIIQIKSGVYYSSNDTVSKTITCDLAVLNMVGSNDPIYQHVYESIEQTPLIFHSIDSTLSLLKRNKNVGVLFIDDDHANQDTINFVSEIHQQFPQIVLIIATSAADGKSAIQLLNEGQIFRYLVKPLTETRLLPMLNAAINRYQEKTLKQNKLIHEIENESYDSTIKRYWKKIISLWK